MEIQILNKKLIAPSSPTPNHLRTLKISPLDIVVPPLYLAAVAYYRAPDIIDLETLDSAKKSVEASLSENLSLFYPFAGRYDEKSQTIDCNDQGVEYVEARVSCEIAQIMYGKADPKLLDRLAPRGAESATTPLMLVQVNVFDCGGIAVGIRFTHRIADASTISIFVDGWATISREGKESVISPPNFDLGYIFQVEDQLWLKSQNPWKKEPTNVVTKRFVFSKPAISSLRALASDFPISRILAVTALLWSAFMRAAGDGPEHGSLLTHIMNLRQRTHLPLPAPETICGNFWRCANTRCPKDKRGLALGELMRLLCGSIRKSMAECADELIVRSAEALMELCEESEREDGEFRMFSSWCRLPVYQADFGWGPPSWVSSVYMPVRNTVLMDSYDGEGIEAWVSLEETEMDRLERDVAFLAFTS